MKVDIVLKSTLYSGNIGLIARSAKNFDINKVKLVNPLCTIGKDSVKFASNARDKLAKIELHTSFDTALKDYHLIFGTTARLGSSRNLNLLTPKQARDKALEMYSHFNSPEEFNIAILFGSEDKGLSNTDLEPCNHLVTIPSSPNHPSLNLSHAVTVFSYEFFNINDENTLPVNSKIPSEPATFEFSNLFFKQLEETLERVGYFKTKKHSHMLNTFKRIATKASLTHEDVTLFLGVLRQLTWYLDNQQKEK